MPETSVSLADGTPEAEVPPELVGHPRYRILGTLGAGGMGVVFKAEHRLMQRIVALKIIPKALTRRYGAVGRFRREVRAAAQLHHPNIVTAYDAEQAGELHFLVMEFIEGMSLDRLVQREHPLPIARTCDLVRQAALGLQHAHERGLVHRDIKPHNLMVTPAGQVKILDFGLARVAHAEDGAGTEPGTVVGTPDYLAPEQALDARQADVRSDIYSLGCTLYFLLTSRPPFPEGSALQKLTAHQQRRGPSPAELRPDVPAALLGILDRMMEKEPARRYQTPAEVAAVLAPLAGSDTTPPVSLPPPPAMSGDRDATLWDGERLPAASRSPRWAVKATVAVVALLVLLALGAVLWSALKGKTTSSAPEPLAEGEIGQFNSHGGPFTRTRFSADCRHALVVGLDFHVHVWELRWPDAGGGAGGEEASSLEGHTARPMSFAFARDGRRALSGGMDHTVRVWNLESGRLLRTFEEHAAWVRGVDFVAESGLAVSGDNLGRVLLWDTRDGRLIHEFRHDAVVYSVSASPSGRLAVSTSGDRTVRVWNLPLLHQAHCLSEHQDNTTCAVLSADERYVLSGSADRTVRWWELKAERAVHVLRGHSATINALALSGDNRRALSADQRGTLRLWDLDKGEPLREYHIPGEPLIRAVAFCPDGLRFVSADDGGVFRCWRLP